MRADELRVAASDSVVEQRPKTLPTRISGAFLRGPIPWEWLRRAGALPGKALAVGIAIWREARRKNTRVVSINQSTIADDFAIDRSTVHRGLAALVAAGLVSVVARHHGQKVVVELLGVE